MKSFSALNFKEKMEYIGILAIYPLILLYEQIGKSVKFLNSRSKQITASILTVCLMLTMIPVMSLTAFASTADWSYPTSTPTESFADGTGEESDPYIIATAQQLANMSYLVNNDNANYGEKHYKLSANIDLAGGDWTPIGDYYNTFMGTFDGAYYTISNLTVQSDLGYCGLFGYVSGMINNVALTNVNVNGSYYVGGVAGYLEGYALINNCSVSGSISGNTAGGISGYLVGDIYNCFSTATVTATAVSSSANAGGITGYLYAGYIMNSYNTGTVSSSVSGEYDYAYSCAGGIVGFARNDSYVQVINCYNIGAVTAENTAIGSDVKCLAGALAGDSPGSIYNSYWLTTSAATITGDNGGKYYCDSFENSTDTVSYNGTTDEVSFTDALNAYVTEYSQSAENYGETAGLRIWTADAENTNNGYPVFEALHTHDNITFSPWFSTDILPTTSGNYYLVNDVTLEDFVWLQENVDITLCLNDKVVAAKEYKTCSIWVFEGTSLTICDCGDTDRSYTENERDYYWELDKIFDNNEKEKLTTGGVITGMANSGILNNGTLTINGGNIVGNYYSGNYPGGGIQNNGTLTINGGHILGNSTGNFYGGGVSNTGTFTMTGGEIAYNVSDGAGAGIHNFTEGTAVISGGIIHNNTSWGYIENISNGAGELTALLADGYAFYDKDGKEIAPEALATAEYLEVKKAIPPHTHTGVEGEFTVLTDWSQLATSGKYYLGDTIPAVSGNISIASGVEITLCLNGKTLDMGSYYITNNGTLNICDCQETVGSITGTNSTVTNNGALSITSGTVSGDRGIKNRKSGTAEISGTAKIIGTRDGIYNDGGTVSISGNAKVSGTSEYGIQNYGTIYLSGSPEISGYASIYVLDGEIHAQSSDDNATYTGGEITVELYTSHEGDIIVYNVDDGNKNLFRLIDSGYLLTQSGENLILAVPHTHSWSTDWTSNDTHHWHECTADGCEVTENSGKDGYGEHDYTGDYTCDCGLHSHDNGVTVYHPLTTTSGVALTGNYYLTDNITATNSVSPTGEFNLCLNGHTLDLGTKYFYVSNGDTVNVYDCQEDGEITGSYGNYTVQIGDANSTFILNSGKVSNTGNGHAIYNWHGTVNILGGKINAAVGTAQ